MNLKHIYFFLIYVYDTFKRAAGGIKVFVCFLWGITIIQIIILVIVVVNLIRTKQEVIDSCIKQTEKEGTQNVAKSAECNNSEVANILIKSIYLISSILVTVMTLFIYIYIYIILFIYLRNIC